MLKTLISLEVGNSAAGLSTVNINVHNTTIEKEDYADGNAIDRNHRDC